jgi:hypothetical protein
MYYVLHSTFLHLYLCYEIKIENTLKLKKMKTAINNPASERFEFAKRILSSFQILIIGLLIPVLFVAGITKDNQKKTWETEKSVQQSNQVTVHGMVDFGKILSDQNS